MSETVACEGAGCPRQRVAASLSGGARLLRRVEATRRRGNNGPAVDTIIIIILIIITVIIMIIIIALVLVLVVDITPGVKVIFDEGVARFACIPARICP